MSNSVPQTPPDAGLPRPVAAWDRFWFPAVRPTTLGLIRICVGLVVLYVHVLYTFQLATFFGPDAWVDLKTCDAMRRESPIGQVPAEWVPVSPDLKPPERLPPAEARELKRYYDEWGTDRRLNLAEGNPVWSVWYHLTDPTAMLALHGLILVAMAMFTAGCCTRVTSVLTWVGALSYIQRSQVTLFGMDTMMNILLIYLMLGPSGGALSVDRLIARWWAGRRARKAGRPAPPWEPPAPSRSAGFALRLIQIHFCFIYLASGLSKLLGSTWWGGTALWLTWANYEFAPFQYKLYQDLLIWLADHRLVLEFVMSGAVLFTLVLEIGLPFMIWVPQLRWAMIVGAVLLHTGIAVTMGLTTFGLLMLCMLLAFVPVETVDRLLARARQLRLRRAARPAAAAVAAGAA